MAENTANAEKFYALYRSDEALRDRVRNEEAMYPGCLEIRDAVVTDVILPIAAEVGLPFTLNELRAFETRRKMNSTRDTEDTSSDIPDEEEYWLLDHGWEEDKDKFQYLSL